MSDEQMISEAALASLAKKLRKEAGKKRAQAARDFNVSQTSIFQAEEQPKQGLQKLRVRMIEKYSCYRVEGPLYRLKKK